MMNENQLDQTIENLAKEAKIPGMAVIASHQGDVIYEKYVGYRHVEKQLPVTANTIFGLASLTKSVVAVAIMMLQDQGKIAVEDRVIKWLPELKQWNQFHKQHITIHNLLTHSAGFSGMGAFHLARRESIEKDPDGAYLFGSFAGSDYVYTVRELMDAMIKEDAPFIGKPGELFNYSNESYALLQEIVERASGEAFATFTREYIFKPLNMTRATYTLEHLDADEDVTNLYAFTKEEPKRVFHSPSWWASGEIYGAGALKASAKDVQKYIELFRQNGTVNGINLVSSEAIEQMKTKHITTPNAIGYGYGLIVGTYLGKPVVSHGGGVKGISSYMLATDEMTVTVLTNIAEVAAENIALSVLEAYQPDETMTDDPVSPRVISLSNDERKEYVGHYETNERQSVDVEVIGDGLRLYLQSNQAMDVKPIGNDQFMLPDGKKVTFLRYKNRTIRGIFRGMRFIQKKGATNNEYKNK